MKERLNTLFCTKSLFLQLRSKYHSTLLWKKVCVRNCIYDAAKCVYRSVYCAFIEIIKLNEWKKSSEVILKLLRNKSDQGKVSCHGKYLTLKTELVKLSFHIQCIEN